MNILSLRIALYFRAEFFDHNLGHMMTSYERFIQSWRLSFWLFLATMLTRYYIIVCLFFLLSYPSCLANGIHHIENQAT